MTLRVLELSGQCDLSDLQPIASDQIHPLITSILTQSV